MKPGEILRKPHTVAVNIVNGLRTALESRKFGVSAEHRAAYEDLRDVFTRLFDNNPQKVGTLKSDSETKRMLFNWADIGSGSLDEKAGVYKLHVVSTPYDFEVSIWGYKKKTSHSIVELAPKGATITQYVETSITPPTEKPFPMVSESKAKTTILDLQTAQDLAEVLESEAFRPTIDSWFADYPSPDLS